MDLKDENSTWDETFLDHKFTDRQKELLKNFNLRYECNDARDDHYNTMRKKISEAEFGFTAHFSHNFLGEKDKLADFIDEELDDNGEENFPQTLGKKTRNLRAEMEEIRQVLAGAKWLNKTKDGLLTNIDTTPLLPLYKTKTTWSKIVKEERNLLTLNKLANMPETDETRTGSQNTTQTTQNTVKELPFDYFKPKAYIDSNQNEQLKVQCCVKYTLNKEQEQAFRLVADHASSNQPTTLKMYLGGMGGSGKSQVIKAITKFFELRKEAHRFMILGPTGSTATLRSSKYHGTVKRKTNLTLTGY